MEEKRKFFCERLRKSQVETMLQTKRSKLINGLGALDRGMERELDNDLSVSTSSEDMVGDS